jgi:hypothetical protein
MGEKEAAMSDENDFLNFVFEKGSDELTYYTHRTENKEVALKITKEGLRFSDSFQKTTDLLLNDPVHIRYWQNLRKEYGQYTVIIGISNGLIRIYQNLMNTMPKCNYEVQQILTDEDPFNDEESEEIFTVPVQFIKGFWDGEEKKGIYNLHFDPRYESPKFKRNIDNLMLKKR